MEKVGVLPSSPVLPLVSSDKIHTIKLQNHEIDKNSWTQLRPGWPAPGLALGCVFLFNYIWSACPPRWCACLPPTHRPSPQRQDHFRDHFRSDFKYSRITSGAI